MGIGKYKPTKRNIDKRPDFDEMVAPYFHKGNDIGCAVLHGFTGTPANMLSVAHALSGEGYTTYVPCLSGHATTLRDMDAQSDRIWIKDALSAYDRLIDEGCKSIFMLGLSMGGLLSSIVAQQRQISGLVLMSTPFVLKKYLTNAGRISGVLPYVTLSGKSSSPKDPYKQGYRGAPLRKLRDLERLTKHARDGLNKISCPTLILQSAHDTRVDLKSVEIARHGLALSDIEVIMLENSPHSCTFGPEKELVAAHCLAFIRRVAGQNPAK